VFNVYPWIPVFFYGVKWPGSEIGHSPIYCRGKYEWFDPAEAVGFFRAKESSACLPSEGK
jgi:hypothetical protein